jgi:bifunctional N-acetylglucosamine-1-phosphate-uridyltransferase/glucosamine-1-phosphate-acetyltransferase GlmU-like protein
MTRWTGIVVASSVAPGDGMQSSLPGYLHPIAGRPLLWHTVAQLARLDPPPERVIVVAGVDVPAGLFADISGAPVAVVRHEELGDMDSLGAGDAPPVVVVVDGSASVSAEALQALVASPRGSWLGAGSLVAAARLDPQLAPEVLRVPTPLQSTRGVLIPSGRIPDSAGVIVVRDRIQFAAVAECVRERILHAHMSAGVTFLLPASVLVDVDVRIGTDTTIYPGVVLEGDTTIGDETVIGPGCRIIDSWIGSGVELKGWNYVAHTSVRNRAILEPYVRRGFD